MCLSDISEVNNWLGRGNFTGFPHVAATFDEFRLYDRALSMSEIEASRLAGPEVLSGTLPAGQIVAAATAFLRRDFAVPPPAAPCAIPMVVQIFEAPESKSYRLEWSATPGRKYLIQSSADLLRWFNVPTLFTATRPFESWIDPGPPSTERSPSADTERFYRVLELGD